MASRAQRQNPKPDHQDKLIATAQQWSGPLPPPGALQQFNNIIPNGAERIMAMVESEQAHRQTQEDLILAATVRDTKRGQVFGAGISLAALAAAAWTAYIGAHPAVSIALVGLPIFAIVQAIVKSKSNGN